VLILPGTPAGDGDISEPLSMPILVPTVTQEMSNFNALSTPSQSQYSAPKMAIRFGRRLFSHTLHMIRLVFMSPLRPCGDILMRLEKSIPLSNVMKSITKNGAHWRKWS
jgi:hypothetical protein